MVVVPGELDVRRGAPATKVIVFVNVLVYIYTSYRNLFLSSTQEAIYQLGFTPATLLSDPVSGVVRIFTAMFTHADLLHIFFNMYFLWLFGTRVESTIGTGRYLLLYFTSGIAAVLFHVGFIPVGGYDSLLISVVGASGAISGVLGAYLLLYPSTRLMFCTFFLLLPFCFPISASAFLLIWFAEQVIYAYLQFGGVAYIAHIGGFLAGLVLTWWLGRSVATRTRAILFDYWRKILEQLGIIVPRPRGMGSFSKILLSLLIAAVLAGFAYGTTYLVYNKPETLIASISAVNQGVEESENLVLVVEGGDVKVSTPQSTLVTILLNRLSGRIYLYCSTCGTTPITEHVVYTTRVRGLNVRVELNYTARYLPDGLLERVNGSMKTQVVKVPLSGQPYLGEEVVIDFEMGVARLDHTYTLLLTTSIVAIAVTLLALVSVVKANEISLIGEEALPPFFSA